MDSTTNNATHDDALRPRLPLLLALIAIALAFRVAAFLYPSQYIVIPDSVALPLSLLGVVFLVCGVWAWRANPSPLTRVFLMYTIGSCVHWGGSIGVGGAGGEITLLFVYLVFTAVGDAAFLDLALRYPHAQNPWGRRSLLLYSPAAIALILVPIAPFLPLSAAEPVLTSLIFLAFAMSISAGFLFIVKWFRATRAERHMYYLTPVVVAMVVSSVLDLLADGGKLPGVAEAWALWYAMVPVTLAFALTRLDVNSVEAS